VLESFAIVTVEPNKLLKPFHERYPQLIDPKDYHRWLTPYANDDPITVPVELLRAYPDERMMAWRVRPLKGNGPELLDPLPAPAEPPAMLF